MFRTAFAALLYFSATSTGSADGLLSGTPATEGHSGHHGYSSLITRDHIQTQLDWRSYYFNRMAVRRHDLLQGRTGQRQPSVDRAN